MMEKYDFIIFGGTGLQGRICARDLLESGYGVLLVGRDTSGIKNLLKNKRAGFLKVDLKNEKDVLKAIKNSQADIVVNCAELIFNVPIMRACLNAKKPLTDLGGLQHVTHEQFKLHDSFRKAGIACITGCGSTPGIASVMAAYAVEQLDSVETITLGFAWDSNIKKFVVPYSMQSIFEEFTEDPITFHNGKFVKENRAICQGIMNFKEIGKQTVYCIVHSEVYTFSKYFKNKGLKNIHYLAGFPEHSFKVIQSLIELRFNSDKKIEINGGKISPLDFTINALKKLKIPKGYKEVENIWVVAEGMKNNKKAKKEMNCIVKTIDGWEEAGSNVDTGRTISIISQMLKNKVINSKGVYAPEAVVPYRIFFKELAKRKMHIYLDGRKIN
ncbi:saccharopine dehydrogenase NADP-binding domain-containing protein [Candidatus Pacearchaeota archaeon]|nr:saccharopine dehydrogenase NADP-binding domain-containing protein [Candidatus Pacearchaeota archaeon]